MALGFVVFDVFVADAAEWEVEKPAAGIFARLADGCGCAAAGERLRQLGERADRRRVEQVPRA